MDSRLDDTAPGERLTRLLAACPRHGCSYLEFTRPEGYVLLPVLRVVRLVVARRSLGEGRGVAADGDRRRDVGLEVRVLDDGVRVQRTHPFVDLRGRKCLGMVVWSDDLTQRILHDIFF